jgi:hypothetical protein
MHFFRQHKSELATIVGWGVHVMLLTPLKSAHDGKVAKHIAGLGCRIEMRNTVFDAIDALILDETRYGLWIIECEAFGGIVGGRRIVSRLRECGVCIPGILISPDCAVQEFPNEQDSPVKLRAPASAVAIRVGFEHAMRGRLVFKTA